MNINGQFSPLSFLQELWLPLAALVGDYGDHSEVNDHENGCHVDCHRIQLGVGSHTLDKCVCIYKQHVQWLSLNF